MQGVFLQTFTNLTNAFFSQKGVAPVQHTFAKKTHSLN